MKYRRPESGDLLYFHGNDYCEPHYIYVIKVDEQNNIHIMSSVLGKFTEYTDVFEYLIHDGIYEYVRRASE